MVRVRSRSSSGLLVGCISESAVSVVICNSVSQLKAITTVRSLAEILKSSTLAMGMFSEVVKLLKIFLTIPVTIATAERSFSALRRLKTYLRSIMTQEQLNNVMLFHCHKERSDCIDLIKIAKDFASTNDHRISFFGTY